MLIFLYLIPLGILLWFVYWDMRKGETVEEYFKRRDHGESIVFLALMPFFNIVLAVIALMYIAWMKIKDIKK
jgi:C4-dicarboxylate transporter